MSNFFNTPSSFGFNTESSYSPDLMNRRSNLSYEDLQVRSIKEYKNSNNMKLTTQHKYTQQEQQNKEKNQNQNQVEYQRAQQMLQSVYLGLSNLQKTKIISIIFKILSNKLYFISSFVFGALVKSGKKRFNNQQDRGYSYFMKESQRHNRLNLLLYKYMNNQNWNRKLKAITFNTLKSVMDHQRNKQLKILFILSNQSTNSYNNLLRSVLNRWKLSVKKMAYYHQIRFPPNSKSTVSYADQYNQIKNTKRQSKNFISAKKQMACKLFLTFFKRKIFNQFCKIKYLRKVHNKKDIPNQNSAKTRKNSVNSYKNKGLNNSGSLISSSYSNQLINTKKMIKMPQKSTQAKSVLKNYVKIVLNIVFILDKVLLKKKRESFNYLIENYNKYSQNYEMKDNPIIFTNILKHLCWLYSQQSIKSKLQSQTQLQQNRNKKLKRIIDRKQEKYRQKMRKIMREWNNQVIMQQKMKIMNKIKQLQSIKYNFIESYK